MQPSVAALQLQMYNIFSKTRQFALCKLLRFHNKALQGGGALQGLLLSLQGVWSFVSEPFICRPWARPGPHGRQRHLRVDVMSNRYVSFTTICEWFDLAK